jgi:hypothetical protein
MCSNASKTVASLMAAIQPGLINLLTVTGIASTTQGQAAIKAYDAALAAVEAWVPGTTAQDVIQVIDAFTAVFDTLPFPSEVSELVDIVSAGIVTVIGVLTGNSPAPLPTSGPQIEISPTEVQEAHAVAVAHDTTVKVQALVPGFKRSIWHSPASQYKTAWNNGVVTVSKANPKYATLKYA